jgi:glycolate oxidase iron-sulfur subunit
VLPRRVLFGRLLKVAGRAQRILAPQAEGRLRHLPLVLSGLGKGRRIPEIAPQFLRQILPERNLPPEGTAVKVKAGYFSGCMTDYVFPELGRKVVSFLTRNGVEVSLPRQQGCCGAPVYLGAGDFATGRKLADANAEAFKDLDYVIVDCATCGSAIRDYPKFLADTPARMKAYSALAAKVVHISSFLVDILRLPSSAYRLEPQYQGKTVTWHDPCHLSRYLGVKVQPRVILRSLPGITYVEMNEADRCCGMAGGFSLHHYELSKKIADRKVNNIIASGADIVVSGCPGCEIQLLDSLARHNSKIEVRHLMELLA